MSNEQIKKTAIITGGGSGLGLGVARAYVERGGNVVLNGRSESKLHAAAKEIGPSERIAVVAGDIGLQETGQQLVKTAVDRFGRVDLLLNNAGIFTAKPFTEYTSEELDQFLSYLRGTYLLSQAVVEPMRKQGGGAIINITTILAYRGVLSIPSSAPMAAKGGIQALTPSLAIELAKDNIRVNAVAPGIIKTPLHGLKDNEFEELNGMQPLGRVGEVKDIVDAVLYLADAEFVTGVVLPVDGGVSAGGR